MSHQEESPWRLLLHQPEPSSGEQSTETQQSPDKSAELGSLHYQPSTVNDTKATTDEEDAHQRHLQDLLLVCLGGALAVVLCLAVIAVVNSQPEKTIDSTAPAKAGTETFFCSNLTCLEHSRRLMGYIDWSRAACSDFWAHACAGRNREVPIRADYFDASSAAMTNAVLDFERITRTMNTAYSGRAERFGVIAYQSCVERWFLSRWKTKVEDMKKLFDEHLGEPSGDNDTAKGVNDVIISMSARFWFFPFIRVRVLPRKETERVFDAHLFPPEFSGTLEMFKVDRFRQEYIAAFRALCDALGLRLPLGDADAVFDFEKDVSESLVDRQQQRVYVKWVSITSLPAAFDVNRYLNEVFSLDTPVVALRSQELTEYFKKVLPYLQSRRIVINNFAFRLFQHLVLFFDFNDPKIKSFVQFVSRYRYGAAEPVSPRLYCLPFLEHYLGPVFMEIIRRSQYAELEGIRSQMLQSYNVINHRTLEAGQTDKSLVQRSSGMSFLSEDDANTYVNMMEGTMNTFEFFLPPNSEGFLTRILTVYQDLPEFDKENQFRNLETLTSSMRHIYRKIHTILETGELFWEGGIFRGEPYYESYTDRIYFPYAFSKPPFYHPYHAILAHGYPAYGLILISTAIRRVVLVGSANRTAFSYPENISPFDKVTRSKLQRRLDCIESQLVRESLPLSQVLEIAADQAAMQFVRLTYTYALNHFNLNLRYDVRLQDLDFLSERQIFYLNVVQGRCGAVDIKSHREHGGVLGRRDPVAAVNVPLWNVADFRKTFKCHENSGMSKYKGMRCRGLFDTVKPSSSHT